MAPSAQSEAHPPAPVPAAPSPESLRAASQGCRACDLYAEATQAVLGEGPIGARVMLVGEQPGDREDREGHVFVGPAGRILDQSLERAGIPRGEAYITNAVKHFRFRTPLPSDLAPRVTVTTHPSAILRTPPEGRAEALDALVSDLETVAHWLHA